MLRDKEWNFHTNFEQQEKQSITIWEVIEDFSVNYQVTSIILDIKSGTFTKIVFQYFTVLQQSLPRAFPNIFKKFCAFSSLI